MANKPASGLMEQPVRISERFDGEKSVKMTGFLKLRLGHSANGSVLVPEQLFIKRKGFWFYQVSFFGPPILNLNSEPDLHVAKFNLDVGDPRSVEHTRILATIRSDKIIRRYDNGAQIYRCEIEGPPSIVDCCSGRARVMPDGDFALELFHITNADAAADIVRSNEIWSSPWNLQGTRKLTNVAYVYLTSLSEIRDEGDLRRIAMASDGVIGLQTTSSRPREDVLKMTVYRESTTGRTDSLPVAVPVALLPPPHLLLHRSDEGAYYEVVGPEIFRIGVLPGETISYSGGNDLVSANASKQFSYIVVGDATEIDGLAAPYDEEETKHIMHLERLDRLDLFEFWRENANSDQIAGRAFEARQFD